MMSEKGRGQSASVPRPDAEKVLSNPVEVAVEMCILKFFTIDS